MRKPISCCASLDPIQDNLEAGAVASVIPQRIRVRPLPVEDDN
jgi:hypothetical protein